MQIHVISVFIKGDPFYEMLNSGLKTIASTDPGMHSGTLINKAIARNVHRHGMNTLYEDDGNLLLSKKKRQ